MRPLSQSQQHADAASEVAHVLTSLDPASLPDPVIDATKPYIIDCFGGALGGMRAAGTIEVLSQLRRWGGAPEATVWGFGDQLPAPMAGLANAQMSRTLDLDDVYEPALSHVTCSTLPAALAMAEATGRRDGRTLVGIVALGRDLVARLGVAAGARGSTTGRSNMYQFNAFGAAAIASLYLGLDAAGLQSALGLVYGQGLSAKQGLTEGAQVPVLHQAMTTQLGIQCAYFAAQGLQGAREVLEGPFGYFPLYGGGHFKREALLDGLGSHFLALDSNMKKYPVCMQSHTAIEATLAAKAELHDPSAEEIGHIHIGLNRESYHMVYDPVGQRRRPTTTAQLQFSLPWIVGLAATRGEISLQQLLPDPDRDHDVAAVADRMTCDIDPEIEARSSTQFTPAVATVTLVDGRQATSRVELLPGSSARPLSRADLRAKFRSCAAWGWESETSSEATEALLAALEHLDEADDVGKTLALSLAPH